MNARRKNILVLALTVAASLPAFALLFSPAPVAAAPEREGVVTVGEISVAKAPPPVALEQVPVARKAPAAKKAAPPAEDPRIAARSRLYDPTARVTTSPNAKAGTCAPNCVRTRPVAYAFDAPGNLPR